MGPLLQNSAAKHIRIQSSQYPICDADNRYLYNSAVLFNSSFPNLNAIFPLGWKSGIECDWRYHQRFIVDTKFHYNGDFHICVCHNLSKLAGSKLASKLAIAE